MNLIYKNFIFLLLIFSLVSCGGGGGDSDSGGANNNSNPTTNNPNNGSDTQTEFTLAKEVFALESSENNLKEEKVLFSNASSYTWSLSKNVDFGSIELNKDGTDLIFDYTPNLTINNIEDSFSIKIRYIEDSQIKEKNFTVKIQIGDINSGGGFNGGSGGSDSGSEFDITWKTVITKANKDSFNEKIVDSSYTKTFTYEVVKDVCSGSSFFNKIGNKLYLSYSPSLSGTESIKIKVTQEKDDGSFLVEEKEVFINIAGVSAVRECSSGDSGGGDTGGGDSSGGDDVVSAPEESHTWILDHFYYDYNIKQNKFFTSTFQNFFSYEVLKQPCSGTLTINKIDNELFFNFDPEDNKNGTESFIIRIRQKRSENVDLIVEKEVKINVLQSGEVNNSCVDTGGGDGSGGGDSGGGGDGSGGTSYTNSLIITNPINLDSFESQQITIVNNDYETSNYNFNILQNPCKGDFSLSTSGRDLVLNYDPLDQFFGTQSFNVEYVFYNENNILEKQQITFYVNINGESSVDNSCRESSGGGDSGGGSGGGVIGGDGGDGSAGQGGSSCDPLVTPECDDGTVDNPVETVELGYTFTFNESNIVNQNTTFNGTFGIGTPPGQVLTSIVNQPKKGILQLSSDPDKYTYIPFTNHAGDDYFTVNFDPQYDGLPGGSKTFYIKLKASRESLSFEYVGFTSEPDYVNIINSNDSRTDKLLQKGNLLVGFNKINDHFVTLNPNSFSCPSVNTYYFLKMFGISEVYNQNLSYGGLWSCSAEEGNIAYLNEEKIIFNTGDYVLLGEGGTVYLGILKSSASNQTANYKNLNYSNFNSKRLFYENSENDSLNLSENLLNEINAISYLNLGNGQYAQVSLNYYGGYDLKNLYTINDGILNLEESNDLIGSFIIIDGTYYVYLEKYILNNEDKGQTLLIINSN